MNWIKQLWIPYLVSFSPKKCHCKCSVLKYAEKGLPLSQFAVINLSSAASTKQKCWTRFIFIFLFLSKWNQCKFTERIEALNYFFYYSSIWHSYLYLMVQCIVRYMRWSLWPAMLLFCLQDEYFHYIPSYYFFSFASRTHVSIFTA